MSVKKKRCAHCQKSFLILIECSLCRENFCITDRAPETHVCKKIEVYKKQPSIYQNEKIFKPKMEYI